MTEHEKFKDLLEQLGISYKDLADKLGMKYTSVTNQLAPAKKLPRWAKSMLIVALELNLNLKTENEVSNDEIRTAQFLPLNQ